MYRQHRDNTCRAILRVLGDRSTHREVTLDATRAALAPLFPLDALPGDEVIADAIQWLLAEGLLTQTGKVTAAGERSPAHLHRAGR